MTSYDAWGNPQRSGGLTSCTPFGFAGAYTDPTGLIYLLHRYYDPRPDFLIVDLDVQSTLESYAYVDPVDAVDSRGEFAVRIVMASQCALCRVERHPGRDQACLVASRLLDTLRHPA